MIRLSRLWRRGGELSRTAGNARARWTARESLVLELRDEDGRRGQGEASPLEGYSPDSIDAAERALEALRELRLPEPAGPELPALDVPLSPSARCAFETAWLDLAARRAGRSLPALLGAEPAARAAVGALLPAEPLAAQLAAAEEAWRRGFRSLKVKLGAVGGWEAELDLLGALRRRFGPELRLRADANGAFCPGELPSRFRDLEPFGLELLEEPVSGRDWRDVPEAPFLLAADESLQRLEPELFEAFRRGVARVAVLKPTTLGGPASCLALAKRLAPLRVRPLVGHAFEGPLAFAAGAALALALAPELASGLDRHVGLSAWPEVELPFAPGPELRSWEAPGLGLSLEPP